MAADEDEAKAGKSGSERRSGRDRRQRPPVTIDLTARPVGEKADAAQAKSEPEKADPAKPAAAGSATAGETESPGEPGPARTFQSASVEETPRGRGPTPKPDRDGWRRLVGAGVGGGVIGLILVIVLQAFGLLPVPGRSAAIEAREQARAASEAVAVLDRRLMAIEAMTEGLPSLSSEVDGLLRDLSALQARVEASAAKTDVDALAVTVADLGQRLDQMPPAAGRDELDRLVERVGRLETMAPVGGPGEGEAVAALSARIGDSEARLTLLAERLDAAEAEIGRQTATAAVAARSEQAARAMAVVSLRRTAAEGEPFASDLDLLASLGLAGGDVAALRPFAVGVATGESLAAEFSAVAEAIVSATASGGPATGLAGKLLGWAQGLVTVRPVGPVAGGDPPAIVSRMRAAVATGDLAAALAEREGLPEAGKEASAGWAAKAVDRTSLDRLTAALAGAAEAAGQ